MLAFVRSRPGTFRVVGEATVLFPDSSIFAGLEDVRTKDPVERLDYIQFLDATCGYPPAEEFKQIRDVNASALDFLNVRFLLAAPGRTSPAEKWRPVYGGADGTVFENRDVLPRVFAPERIAPLPGAAGWTTLASRKDWRAEASSVGGQPGAVSNGAADVSNYRESINDAAFDVQVSGGRALVIASLVQDGGWSARDESGREIVTTLANGPFLALRLPGGSHRVFLKYSPPGLRTGAWISMASLLAAGVWAAAAAMRRRSESKNH